MTFRKLRTLALPYILLGVAAVFTLTGVAQARTHRASTHRHAAGKVRAKAPVGPCTRTITGRVVSSIIVRPGETVCIVGATVFGNVIVQGGGGLSIENSMIIGSITSRGATFVSICGSPTAPYTPAVQTTSGSITIVGTTGPVTVGAPPGGGCSPNQIGGTLTLRTNSGGTTVFGNTIGAGAHAQSNTNGLLIGANSINGSLTCRLNVPPPTNGGTPNTVTGSKTGQCVGL